MIDRSRIGWSTPASTVSADAWRVRLFCDAVGESDPVYTSLQAAQGLGLPRCPLPLTFLKALEGEHYSSARMLQELGVPLRGVLHAEQGFVQLEPVYVGDPVSIDRTLVDMVEKKGGTLTFLTIETRYRVHEKLAAQSLQTILVRGAQTSP